MFLNDILNSSSFLDLALKKDSKRISAYEMHADEDKYGFNQEGI